MYRLLPILILFLLTACSDKDDTDSTVTSRSFNYDEPPTTYSGWYRPDTETTWQWQLTGTVNTAYNVDLYDIDLFDSSAELISQLQDSGKKVICYFSAGSYEAWREDADDFLSADLGNDMDEWEGEKWLDIRSNNVHTVMEKRLALAADKGCDGVEPDNMDGYTNDPGFDFNAADQLAYNRFIANTAHEYNLSVGLKNDLDQLDALVEYYDFAVNEQCHQYDECDDYTVFTDSNKAVFNAEYEIVDTAALCTAAAAEHIQTLLLPWDLNDSSRFSCQEE